jgi:pimeloyl-ACP methyl ester carboxylesterase
LIFYDVRNRGRSDTVAEVAKLARGIQQDVDDLEVAVRRHFGIEHADLIGHSYIGLMVALYAMKYAALVGRVLQIGPMQPDAATQYPAPLSYADAVACRYDGQDRTDDEGAASRRCRGGVQKVLVWCCERCTSPIRRTPKRINWGRCELPNERNFMQYWNAHLLPSIQSLSLTAEEMAKAKAPVLIVHGAKDRNAPYGAGRDWAMRLPDARLVTVGNAAHAPWIEAPELVFGSIESFFGWRVAGRGGASERARGLTEQPDGRMPAAVASEEAPVGGNEGTIVCSMSERQVDAIPKRHSIIESQTPKRDPSNADGWQPNAARIPPSGERLE